MHEMGKRPLYIFNPEHDLALASGEMNYMAPASARQMAADLALLPVWYAEKEAMILAPSAYNMEFLKNIEKLFGDCAQLVTPPELATEEDFEIIPWGWDLALCRQLSTLGVNESQLPSCQYIEQLRHYSHRSRAVEMLSRLQLNEYFCGESYYLTVPETWKTFVESHVTCLLKAPLSGSGKGLNWCKGEFTSSISGWCTRIGVSQGGVIGEPIYNKVEDFAMEFYSDGQGTVTFAGYSLFRTGGSGMYDGNDLLANARILEKLSAYVSEANFILLENQLKEELVDMLGVTYKGYLGVDMMICQFSESDFKPKYRIHPCVEINLRMNMGVVARQLTDRFLAFDAEGEFHISYYSADGLALEEHQRMETMYPLHIDNGRIRSGYLSLVPVTSRSRYRAWILNQDDVTVMNF